MRRKIKRGTIAFCISLGLMIGISVAAGVYYKLNIQDCGIAGLSSVADLEEMDITLYYAQNTTDESIVDDDNEVTESPIIAAIVPTGQIRQSSGSIEQEFVVSSVIRGEDYISEGQTCYLYQSFDSLLLTSKSSL